MGSVLSLLLSAGAQGEDVTSYVPFVSTFSLSTPGSWESTHVFWMSRMSAFNNGPAQARVSLDLVYQICAPLEVGAYRHECGEIQVPPQTGYDLDYCSYWGDFGPGFMKITSDDTIVLAADVQRVLFLPHCGGGATLDGNPSYNLLQQGSVPLPVYRGLFPENSSVVVGPVDLGALDHPETCITGVATHRRRVNVTLLNAGRDWAEFRLTVRTHRAFSSPVIESHLLAPPGQVTQLNAVPISLAENMQPGDGYDVRVWLSITGSQPFLAYVTTIFEGGEPGTNSVTVYEAKPTN